MAKRSNCCKSSSKRSKKSSNCGKGLLDVVSPSGRHARVKRLESKCSLN